MKNIDLSLKVLSECQVLGVQEYVVCAGARNAPLIHSLELLKKAKVFSFFEERSAAYFAIGRIQLTQKPVALITTSGTAVANLLPAVVESYYQGLPLLLITADRPREYRGTAAPQAIEQVGIFSHYVERVIDLADLEERASLSFWSKKKPLHFNVCFDEPLIDRDLHDFEIENLSAPSFSLPSAAKINPSFIENQRQKLHHALSLLPDPLVIVGPLLPTARPLISSFLERSQWPFLAESLSGLSHLPGHLKAGEEIIKWGFRKKIFKSVLRIGGVPTLRFWRDLEMAFSEIPVGHISNLEFTGLSRPTLEPFLLENFLYLEPLLDSVDIAKFGGPLDLFLEKDHQLAQVKEELLAQSKRSEPALLKKLALGLPKQSRIYLGNSLPIREWDFCNRSLGFADYYGHRGANGIDGQISSFLGWSSSKNPHWGIFGDLTTLYDLSGLWVTSQLEKGCRRIVVVNNGGGQIFNRMFRKDIFLNRHPLKFNHWAEMFDWDYQNLDSIDQFHSSHFESVDDHRVIEIVPEEKETLAFWKQWERLTKDFLM